MITKNIKNFLIACLIGCGCAAATSCSDMLETESEQQAFNPSIDQKTDSLFYAFGIMQALQQAADQYVLQGELRGDLAATTEYTDTMLLQLAQHTATTANAFDSAYVYYRVINNCNYYLAHRDTTLKTGSTNVVIREYVAVEAFRAWAYLQLARQWGRVPFFTEPLTTISQIEQNFPLYNIKEITDQLKGRLEAYLVAYPGISTPIPSQSPYDISGRTINTARLYIPLDVILGDLYLESGDYQKAAEHYESYLTRNNLAQQSLGLPFMLRRGLSRYSYGAGLNTVVADYYTDNNYLNSWKFIFSNGLEMVSFIPMASSSLRGTTSKLPRYFGYNFYRTSSNESAYLDELQITPSQSYKDLSDATTYYYYAENGTMSSRLDSVKSTDTGDMRLNSIIRQTNGADSLKMWVVKYNMATVFLYRLSGIYLHLAEAYNRMGYPDAAFAILKEGITDRLRSDTSAYIKPETRALLQRPGSFLCDEFRARFDPSDPTTLFPSAASGIAYGIHQHGAGVTHDKPNKLGRCYRYDEEIGKKMKEIATKFGVTVGTTKQDTINAMEDILCDEYALELSFEGTRWPDLCRLARHKNQTTTGSVNMGHSETMLYSADFGSQWLKTMMAPKKVTAVDFANESQWYLPFK